MGRTLDIFIICPTFFNLSTEPDTTKTYHTQHKMAKYFIDWNGCPRWTRLCKIQIENWFSDRLSATIPRNIANVPNSFSEKIVATIVTKAK